MLESLSYYFDYLHNVYSIYYNIALQTNMDESQKRKALLTKIKERKKKINGYKAK